MRPLDLSGQSFGRLIALEYVSGTATRRAAWRCRCDCGRTTVVSTDHLRSGRTVSCGCRKLEAARENMAIHAIKPRHGMTGTPTHRTWASMLERCAGDGTKPSHAPYALRGIEVCDRWHLFENFLADMGERPAGMTLDRKDVDRGYDRDNCRWATPSEQQRNKTNTRYLIVDGKRRSLMDVADAMGLKKPAAQYFSSALKRFTDSGMPVSIG